MVLKSLTAWRRPLWLPALAATTALALVSAPARADLIIGVESVTTVSGSAGTTGSFDVTLTNTGPSAVSVGSFSFEISVAGPVTLLDATFATTTAPYIFAGNSFDSLLSLPLNTSSGSTLDASDGDTDPLGATVGNGATVGLGNIDFKLTGTLSTPVTVSLSAFPATSLTDQNFENITIDILNDGQISPVPEPTTLGSAALGALAGTWYFARSRRRRRRADT